MAPPRFRRMTLYQSILVLKFLGVMVYAGGLIAGFVATSRQERRRAAHFIASPALIVTWCTGYALAWLGGFGLFELWILSALLLSFASNLSLVHSVVRGRRTHLSFAASAIPLAIAVIVMVVRPTWGLLR